MISYFKSVSLAGANYSIGRLVSKYLFLFVMMVAFQAQGDLKEKWFEHLSDSPVCLKGKVHARFTGVRDDTPLSSGSDRFEKNFQTGIVTKFTDPQSGNPAFYFSVRNAEDMTDSADEMNRSVFYKWMMVAWERIVGEKTSGRGNSIESQRMELKVNGSSDNPVLTLSGELLIPFNDKNYGLPFVGRSITSSDKGMDDQERTELFKPTKNNRKQQRADANAVARILRVELEDVGSQYCFERDLKVATNDQLVGVNKGNFYQCGSDLCQCGMSACDELDIVGYGGRCEWDVDYVKKKLQDPSSVDYAACINGQEVAGTTAAP